MPSGSAALGTDQGPSHSSFPETTSTAVSRAMLSQLWGSNSRPLHACAIGDGVLQKLPARVHSSDPLYASNALMLSAPAVVASTTPSCSCSSTLSKVVLLSTGDCHATRPDAVLKACTQLLLSVARLTAMKAVACWLPPPLLLDSSGPVRSASTAEGCGSLYSHCLLPDLVRTPYTRAGGPAAVTYTSSRTCVCEAVDDSHTYIHTEGQRAPRQGGVSLVSGWFQLCSQGTHTGTAVTQSVV